jgi:hypothetical protein
MTINNDELENEIFGEVLRNALREMPPQLLRCPHDEQTSDEAHVE